MAPLTQAALTNGDCNSTVKRKKQGFLAGLQKILGNLQWQVGYVWQSAYFLKDQNAQSNLFIFYKKKKHLPVIFLSTHSWYVHILCKVIGL